MDDGKTERSGEFYETVGKATPIQTELKKQSYGDTEFEIKDPNGYVLVSARWFVG